MGRKLCLVVNRASPVETFIAHVSASLAAGTFVRLLLSQPSEDSPLERIIGRLIEIRGEPKLSLTLREARRDTTQNLALADVAAWLAAQLPARFRSAMLETTEKNWQLSASPRGGLKLAAHRATDAAPPARTHDVPKPSALDASARPWLIQLGLCSSDGRVRASMADKYRQLERYLEIMTHLVRPADESHGWCANETIAIADMGSGKGYLTFGIWHLLTRTLGLRADVTGVEARADLVEKTNAVARAVGADSLRFVAGTIADSPLPRLDVLIALHACNTATDDAIRRGISAGAGLIVVSPCCHQELRPQLGRPEPLAPLLTHGILAERMAEWLTDGLRALHLEAAGYATKVIEFIPSEHTPRNLLLAGIRRETPDAAAQTRARAQIRQLKIYFGIEHHALDALLAE